MIDYERVKPGVKVLLSDGTEGVVRGSYLSPDGFVLRVLPGGGGIVQRNVPIADVVDVVEANLTDELHGRGIATPDGGTGA